MAVAEEHRIDRSITIKAPPERVWRALTNPAELSAWFKVQIEGELAPNTEVWMTSTHAGYEGQRFQVRIVEMSPPHRLVWQWHPGEVDPNVDYSFILPDPGWKQIANCESLSRAKWGYPTRLRN